MTDVVLVSDADEPLGVLDKLSAHRPPAPLHRAFSAFLLDTEGRLLLQRRSAAKYHFAGLWANTCCGHPLPGETPAEAARRRADEELGLQVTWVCTVDAVTYSASDAASGLMEHEYDHIVVGRYTGPVSPHPDEVAETRLVTPAGLLAELDSTPSHFAPWLPFIAATAVEHLLHEIEHG